MRYIKREIEAAGGELMLKRNVEFRQLDPLPPGEEDDGIRVYGGHSCAVLQLRGISPLTYGGKPRRLIATASYLDKSEVDSLIAQLKAIRGTLR